MFGLRAGNQNAAVHIKVTSIEFLPPSNVLSRLSLETFVQVTAVVDPGELGQLVGAMCVEIASILAECMRQQHLCRQAGYSNRSFFENLCSLQKGCLQRHAKSAPEEIQSETGLVKRPGLGCAEVQTGSKWSVHLLRAAVFLPWLSRAGAESGQFGDP
jgi:hypothetical protein